MNASPTRQRRAPDCARVARHPLIPSLLATALWAALPVQAAELQGPLKVVNGESLQLGADDRLLHSGGGFALDVNGAGSTATIDGSRIDITHGGSGIQAMAGGTVLIEGGHIQLGNVTDNAGYALNASGAGSVIRANNLVIDAYRNSSGYGTVNATNGGKLWLNGGSVSSEGHALYSSGRGSELHVSGTTISNGANRGVYAEGGALLSLDALSMTFAEASNGSSGRLSASGSGSVLSLRDVDTSNGYFDIYNGGTLQIEGGRATANGGSIRLLGNSANRVYSSGDITGGRFETVGGYGVNVNSWGKLTTHGAHFTVRDGNSGVWLSGADSLADMTDTVISTFGDNGYGHGVDVWGGTATITGGSIDTHGAGVYGLRASGSNPPTPYSRIRAKDLDITTYGNGGGGVFLGGSTADAELQGGSITTRGTSSFGIVQMNTAKLTADGLRIHAQGANSGAYRSYLTAFGPYWNRLVFNNSQLQTEDGPALWLQGSNHELTLNNTDVVARQQGELDDGRLLRVSDTVFTDGSSVATADILFTADNSRLTGDVVVDSATANVRMTLRNGTRFSGALRNASGYQVAQLAIDGSSQWDVRADSSVATLDHAGTIAFVAPGADGFKTVTVTGDYVGNGGQWLFNRALGDDASLGDQLVIEGDSRGTATVSVRNAGGAGALTREGIRLISVSGQSDAQFTLHGRAVAGAYDYFLFKGGISTPDDGNWYLRSEYVPPVDPPLPPDPPIDPPTPPIDPPVDPPRPPIDPPVQPPIDPPLPPEPPRVERPEPAAYLANQNAAQGMFRHSLHDRSGDPATAADDDGNAIAWAQVRSSQPDSHGRGQQVHVDSRLSSVLLGVGRRFEANAGGQLQLGVMAGQGRARNDSRSQVTGYTARGEVIGSSIGLYATWLQDARMDGGAYVDGWLQYGRFRNSVQGEGLQKERYRSHSWTASAEAGYVLPLQRSAARGIYLEPQLQVLHSRYDADAVVEANGTVVEGRDKDSTTTRVGMRLYTRSLTQGEGQVQPFVAVNWWSGGNGAGLAMDGERLQRQLPRDIYEAKAGVQLNLSGGWRGWGEISRQSGGMGFRDIGAQLGVSYRW
ncbi:autotransporter outer membrane beta-barrel domain-containing protein [Stenotrophomonas maltophilia]|uniref:Outer membrane autotransporter barrel domain protein n=2 Tax=Gammaproteobacteria TaxID=1236 RepID=B4SKU1_STRM5|nr:autotransporter outer membrane beta-barrel domain-containing protein [Stenotrophomonas maltophilia]ACF50439.1 outer membrane autotransporter barrel domain protein [Stenotrophomonas maltophilia R551-3]